MNEKARILVVDDDPDQRRHLAWTVEQIGHDPIPAGSLADALRLVRQDELRAVVADLKLSPEKDEEGFEVLEAVKEKDPRIPVLLVTAYGTVDRGARAVLEGAFDFIDRNIPGVDHLELLQHKLQLALEVLKRQAPPSIPLAQVLQNLEAGLRDLHDFFQDAQRREIAFADFKRAVQESLWPACAPLSDQHRQLAVLLQESLHKLPCALDLTPEHLAAFAHLVKGLGEPRLTEEDVVQCVDGLERCGATLFPGLGDRAGGLMELYDQAEEEP
jgi:ActR/RegA family two-component response regulator